MDTLPLAEKSLVNFWILGHPDPKLEPSKSASPRLTPSTLPPTYTPLRALFHNLIDF